MLPRAAAPASALPEMNRAASGARFRAAASRWGTPPLNVTYADVEGNVGFQMVGYVPVRERGEGLVPSPGWSGQYEWRGRGRFRGPATRGGAPRGRGVGAHRHQTALGPRLRLRAVQHRAPRA